MVPGARCPCSLPSYSARTSRACRSSPSCTPARQRQSFRFSKSTGRSRRPVWTRRVSRSIASCVPPTCCPRTHGVLVRARRRGHDRLLRQRRRHSGRGCRSHARRGLRHDGIDRLCRRLAEQDALENRGRHQQAERAIRHRPDGGSVPGLYPRQAAPQMLRDRSRHRDAFERARTQDGRRHLHAPSQVVPDARPPPVPLAPQLVPRTRLEQRQACQARRPQVVRSREDFPSDERPRRARQHDQAHCQVAREGGRPLRVLRTDHHPFDQARSVAIVRGALCEFERS